MKTFILNKLKKILSFILSVSLIVLIWGIVSYRINKSLILPNPKEVFYSLIELFNKKFFLKSLYGTFLRCVYSFLLVIIFSTSLGILSYYVIFLRRLIEIIMSIIKSIPVVSFILLALFWLPSDKIPILVSVLLAVPVMFTSVFDGLNSYNKKDLLVLSCYELSAFQKFLFYRIPRLFPFYSSGLKSSAGIIWKAVTAGEVLTLPRKSLGSILQESQVSLEIQKVFAITIVIIISSYVFCKFIELILNFIPKCWNKILHLYLGKRNFNRIEKKSYDEDSFGLELKNINLQIGDKFLYEDFSLEIKKQESLCLVASSGAGKSSLFNYILENRTKYFSNKLVSYISQDPVVLKNLSVFDNLLLPLINFYSWEEAEKKVSLILKDFSLIEKKDSIANNLSGGEKQRLILARAIIFPSRFLIIDEGFSALDYVTKNIVLENLKASLKKEKRTLFFSSHDFQVMKVLSDRIISLNGSPLKISFDVIIKNIEESELENKIINSLK